MDYIYNDGGRSKYFKAKNVCDCVTRAISIAANKDYKEVYDYIKSLGADPRNGVTKNITKKASLHYGGVWKACMQIGKGCTTHLKKEDLPSGRIMCQCSKHCVAVINGVINDIYSDVSRDETRCVYGYWEFK